MLTSSHFSGPRVFHEAGPQETLKHGIGRCLLYLSMNDSKLILDWDNGMKKKMKLSEYFLKSLYLDKNLSLVPPYLWSNEYLNRFAIKELHQWFSVTFLLIYFLMVLLDYDYSYIGYVGLLTSLGLVLLILIGRFLSSLSFNHCCFSDFDPRPFCWSHPLLWLQWSGVCRWYLYYLGRFWLQTLVVPTNGLIVMLLRCVTEQEVRGPLFQGWLRGSDVSLGTRTPPTSQLCHSQNHPASF